jgi:hypothetical protein
MRETWTRHVLVRLQGMAGRAGAENALALGGIAVGGKALWRDYKRNQNRKSSRARTIHTRAVHD